MTSETQPEEVSINIESIRIPPYRDHYGVLSDLGDSIKTDGLRHPITLWKDGTLISGARRLRTQFLMAGAPGGSQYRQIRAVFVETIEDAAKRLLIDSQDEDQALPMKVEEMCRLWEVLRQLDEPAAVQRLAAARRRGIELRKATLAGKRKPSRSGYSTDYVLDTLAPAFGISGTTASRQWAIYMLASAAAQPEERREQARQAMRDIDSGVSSLWRAYSELFSGRKPVKARPRPAAPPAEPVPAARQLATWNRSLPHLEGLVAGLIEVGPPNSDLTWDQVGPVHARLSTVRRDLEKIILKMKEFAV